jgi:uncharacterized membrane protein
MSLNKKLHKWHQAGLIDQQTLLAIEEFEHTHSKPMVLWAAGGLGAFAIVIGVISVVAANWLFIPDAVKLGVALFLCTALAFAIYQVHQNSVSQSTELLESASSSSSWLKDVLIILYYGFTLATMALIGQTYQLDGSVAGLLLVWTVVTLPLILLAKGRFIATVWVIATAITYALNADELFKFSKNTLGFTQSNAEAVAMCFILLGPLVFIVLSRLPWLTQHRPQFSKQISNLSWLVIIVGGFFAQFLWYSDDVVGEIPLIVFIVTGIATALTCWFIPTLYNNERENTHFVMMAVLLCVYLLASIACWHTDKLNIVGAITNLLYLCLLAWAALKISSTGLFNFITAIIAIRVLFIYFEVFGSLIQTGIGLIIGGLLTLLLAWLWFKKSGQLAGHLSQEIHGAENKEDIANKGGDDEH